jgi:hypothetical protein
MVMETGPEQFEGHFPAQFFGAHSSGHAIALRGGGHGDEEDHERTTVKDEHEIDEA